MLRISNIKNIFVLERTFSYNMELLDFVENIQTPFAKYEEDYKEKLIKVIVEVDKSKISFFENILMKLSSSSNLLEKFIFSILSISLIEFSI